MNENEEKNYVGKNSLLYVWNKIKTLLGGKVDKEEGKGLSTNDLTDELKEKILKAGDSSFTGAYSDLTSKPKINNVELGVENSLEDLGIQASELGKGLSSNDYTNTEKEKLSGISDGADVNVIESVKVNGTTLEIADKEVNIIVPTKMSDLNNDKEYQTSDDVNSSISSALENITGIDFLIVESLPETGEKGIIYLMSNSGKNPNIYDEYIYVNSVFEKIGTTDVDLTGYVKETDLIEITNEEIDEIFNT